MRKRIDASEQKRAHVHIQTRAQAASNTSQHGAEVATDLKWASDRISIGLAGPVVATLHLREHASKSEGVGVCGVRVFAHAITSDLRECSTAATSRFATAVFHTRDNARRRRRQ
jgi:hypothetical protein